MLWALENTSRFQPSPNAVKATIDKLHVCRCAPLSPCGAANEETRYTPHHVWRNSYVLPGCVLLSPTFFFHCCCTEMSIEPSTLNLDPVSFSTVDPVTHFPICQLQFCEKKQQITLFNPAGSRFGFEVTCRAGRTGRRCSSWEHQTCSTEVRPVAHLNPHSASAGGGRTCGIRSFMSSALLIPFGISSQTCCPWIYLSASWACRYYPHPQSSAGINPRSSLLIAWLSFV